MCKRSDDDPLIRILTDRYKLNILRLPRRGVGVGELVIREGKDLRCAGSVKRFFDPDLDIPRIESAALPDVDGISSARLSSSIAAAPLTGILTALGVPYMPSVSASFRRARDVSVTFTLTGTRYQKTDLVALGGELASRVMRRDNALYNPAREYYIAHAAAEASGLKVGFESAAAKEASLHLELAEIINADTQVNAIGDQSGHLIVSSPEPVTFGIAVVRLKLDGDNLQLDAVDHLRAVRGRDTKPGSVDGEQCFFFGGTDGEALIELS